MLRPLTWRDIPVLAALEPELFAADAWSEASWWSELAQRPRGLAIQCGLEQPKILLIGLVRRHQLIRNLRKIIQRQRTRIIGLQSELRIDQLTACQVGQLGVFTQEVGHPDLGKPFQP